MALWQHPCKHCRHMATSADERFDFYLCPGTGKFTIRWGDVTPENDMAAHIPLSDILPSQSDHAMMASALVEAQMNLAAALDTSSALKRELDALRKALAIIKERATHALMP